MFKKVELNKAAIMEYENEIALLDARLMKASEKLLDETLTQAQFLHNKTLIEARQRELRESILRINSEYFIETRVYTAPDLWKEFSVHQKREAMKLLINRIEIRRAPMASGGRTKINTDRVVIRWKKKSEVGLALVTPTQ